MGRFPFSFDADPQDAEGAPRRFYSPRSRAHHLRRGELTASRSVAVTETPAGASDDPSAARTGAGAESGASWALWRPTESPESQVQPIQTGPAFRSDGLSDPASCPFFRELAGPTPRFPSEHEPAQPRSGLGRWPGSPPGRPGSRPGSQFQPGAEQIRYRHSP